MGIQGNAITHTLAWLRVGEAIWGANEPTIKAAIELKTLTKEDIRGIIMKMYTPATWIAITSTQRNTMMIADRGVATLGTLFEVPGNPKGKLSVWLQLGLAIWGEYTPEFLKALEEYKTREKEREGMTTEACRRLLKEQFTPASWAAITSDKRHLVTVGPLGLVAFARLLGIEGVHTRNLEWFQLGAAVWGADDPIIQKALAETTITPEDIIQKLKASYTAQAWATMSADEIAHICVAGRKIKALVTACGIPNVSNSRMGFLEFGKKIYGADPAIVTAIVEMDSMDAETIKSLLRAQRTAAEWVALSLQHIRKIKVRGRSMQALATVLGCRISNRWSRNIALRLGAIIYGEDDPDIVRAAEEDMKKKVSEVRTLAKAQYTAQQWIDIPGTKWDSVQVAGKKIRAIGTLFGFTDKIKTRKEWLQLGICIWGSEEKVLADALATETITVDDITRLIKEEYTSAVWTALTMDDFKKLSTAGRGLFALCTLYAIPWDGGSRLCGLRIGEKIWGTDDTAIAAAIGQETISPEAMKALIMNRYSLEQWLHMGIRNIQHLNIEGRAITAVGRALGIAEKLPRSRLSLCVIARKVWGEDSRIDQLERIAHARGQKNKEE